MPISSVSPLKILLVFPLIQNVLQNDAYYIFIEAHCVLICATNSFCGVHCAYELLIGELIAILLFINKYGLLS